MQKIKCIAKNKDKNGIITQYQIQDVNGKIMTVTPEQLKEAIKSKKVECINLTLTSDNRLINKGKQEKDKIYISPTCKWTPYGTNLELDKEVDCYNREVRVAVAEQGYGLDKLINDKNYEVRVAVAEQGYGFDKLINDEQWCVRIVVAERGYGLDKLVNDVDPSVRAAVARQGYGLDKLVNDEHWFVRMLVARQGYGLDKLIYDEYEYVRETVQKYLKNNGYYKSIFEWIKANPNKVVTDIDIDEWLNSDNAYKRAEVAKHGYGLDKLVNDEDWYVREKVAKQGYGLDKLINDENERVRAAVAEQGYGLDKLISDKNWEVCREVDWYLKNNDYESTSDWIKANLDKVYNK